LKRLLYIIFMCLLCVGLSVGSYATGTNELDLTKDTADDEAMDVVDTFISDLESLEDSDYYGGVYIDNKGVFHVLKVNTASSKSNALQMPRINSAIDYVVDSVDYSYKDISTAADRLDSMMNDLDIVAMGSDVMNNQLTIITSKKLDDSEKQRVKDIAEFDNIDFQTGERPITDSKVIGGTQIIDEDTDKPYSLGACVSWEHNGNTYRGFVTAGHNTSIGDVFSYDDKELGTVETRHFYGDIDASFLENTGSYSLSNQYLKNVTCSRSHSAVVNQSVTLYGGTSRTKTGTITSTDYRVNYDGVTLRGLCAATYSSKAGDSGGSVIMTYNNIKYIAGIHSGHSSSAGLSFFTNFSRLEDTYDASLDWD